MVVMWKENPTLSSLSSMRVLSQVPVWLWTLRSVFSHSARVLTIIADTTGSLVLGLLAHHGGKGLVEDGKCLVDLLIADDQRAQALDHFAVGAAGLDHQAVFEGMAAHCGGNLAIGAADADHHPAALEERSEERRVGKEGRSRWSPDH